MLYEVVYHPHTEEDAYQDNRSDLSLNTFILL